MAEGSSIVHTVLLDRSGYVIQLWMNTRAATLDERKYPGTLMEATGPIAPGMRWDGQAFVSPPPRIPPEAVLDEKARRSAMFPERFVKQITALGGDNAMKVSKYLGELHNTAERMMLSDPPADFKDDRHWPTVPELHDLPIAHRVHEFQSVSPVSGQPVTIAPVFNVAAPTIPEAKPIVLQQAAPSERIEVGGFALDPSDPLYHRKMALIGSIAAFDERNGGIPESIEPAVPEAALRATVASSVEELAKHESRVHELLEAA